MSNSIKLGAVCFTAFCLALAVACSTSKPAAEGATLKQMPAGKEYSGFLSDYSNLKPNPEFENTVSYAKGDSAKKIRQYFAVIIEPVQLYVATNADVSKIPDRGRTAMAEYFQHAITNAVSDAFPVVTEPGPLVLRLRAALVGVDVGGDIAGGAKDKDDPTLERALNIGKVGVEMELVDSETGEQIAAAVDRQNLGDGAEVGSASFSREQKFDAARRAFDGWAARLRAFLDSANEIPAQDADRVLASYHPYGEEVSKK
jgi:hypothetical protein